jgi:glycerol-3-phosphate dehydrogenase
MRLDDVLSRRTRIAFEAGDGGFKAARGAAVLMAPELDWDSEHTSGEIEQYRRQIAAEQAARSEPDDKLAFEARLQASDPVQFYGQNLAPQ